MTDRIDKSQQRWDAESDGMKRILDKHGIPWPRCGAEVGLGWLPIVDEALGDLVAAGWCKDLHQVKQKFCGLRIYIGYGKVVSENQVAIFDEIINVAEAKASKACEDCGKPHELTIPRAGIALCKECWVDRGYDEGERQS